MKRSASASVSALMLCHAAHEGRPQRPNPEDDNMMTTRSRAKKQRQRQKEHERSLLFSASSLLQAVSLVLQSGYLSAYDCWTAAATCINWSSIWRMVEPSLPEIAKMEILVASDTKSKATLSPPWIPPTGLRERVVTFKFLHHVLQIVEDFETKTAKKQKRAKRRMPMLGRDIQVAIVSLWEPFFPFDGGVILMFGKKRYLGCNDKGEPSLFGRNCLTCSIDSKHLLVSMNQPGCWQEYHTSKSILLES